MIINNITTEYAVTVIGECGNAPHNLIQNFTKTNSIPIGEPLECVTLVKVNDV
jgi:hypothetical protein